jgi:hypothetical protein
MFTGIWKYGIGSLIRNRAELKWNDKLDAPLQKAINTGEGVDTLFEDFVKTMEEYFKPSGVGSNSAAEDDFAYLPKDWGLALTKLQEKAKKGEFEEAQVFSVESAHFGWYEFNTGKTRWSTTGRKHRPFKESDKWAL